jgi:hypothetical protein
LAGAQHNPTGEAVSSPATSARILSAVDVMPVSTQIEGFPMEQFSSESTIEARGLPTDCSRFSVRHGGLIAPLAFHLPRG